MEYSFLFVLSNHIRTSITLMNREFNLITLVAKDQQPSNGGGWNGATIQSYDVHAVPALYLICPDGKVLLSDPSVDELAEKIDEIRK